MLGDVGAVSASGSRSPVRSAISECVRLRESSTPRSTWGRLVGASVLSPEVAEWFPRAVGEFGVVDAIAQLGADWAVLHGVDLGEDAPNPHCERHVVVGPAGVVVILVYSGGPIWVGLGAYGFDGSRLTIVRDAEFSAVAVRRLVRAAMGAVPVTGCVVVPDRRRATVWGSPRGVTVLHPQELKRWLRELPRVLSPAQRAEAVSLLEAHQDARERDRICAELDAFSTLRRCVTGALHRRMVLSAVLLSALWLGAFLVNVAVLEAWRAPFGA